MMFSCKSTLKELQREVIWSSNTYSLFLWVKIGAQKFASVLTCVRITLLDYIISIFGITNLIYSTDI